MTNHWLSKSEYPFKANYMEINSQKMHYIDEGIGETLVFVHGTPSWSFDFRHLIKSLKSKFRCIAVDHIGFGLSDKPADYDYSTQNHSHTLQIFIERMQLHSFTLVVHDFGGPIGLNYAISNPQMIKRLVILNCWLWSSQNDPAFLKLKKMIKSPLLPFLYTYFNFSPRYLLPLSFGEKKLSKSLLTNYTKPFSKRSQRRGPLAFAYSLVNDQQWFETLWNNRKSITDKPTLFVWGMKDAFIQPNHLEKFQNAFDNSTTLKLETCGHFPQEEEPEKVSEAILKFLND